MSFISFTSDRPWGRLARIAAIPLGVLLLGVPAVAFSGGGLVGGGYIGELPASWFDDEPCRTEPITYIEGDFIREWQIDVSAVAADGDPNTYLRCVIFANDRTNTCIVGLSDGSVIGCEDNSGPHVLPEPGHMAYLAFDPTNVGACNVYVGTHDSFGEADPKCRSVPPGDGDGDAGGDGDGSGDGDGDSPPPALGCNSSNSVPLADAVWAPGRYKSDTALRLKEGTCYSTVTETGTLSVSDLSRTGFTVFVEDGEGTVSSTMVPRQGDGTLTGLSSGTLFLIVDAERGKQVFARIQPL